MPSLYEILHDFSDIKIQFSFLTSALLKTGQHQAETGIDLTQNKTEIYYFKSSQVTEKNSTDWVAIFAKFTAHNMMNQAAVEALYSATFAEDYLDVVENLPNELQRHLSRLREHDLAQYREAIQKK